VFQLATTIKLIILPYWRRRTLVVIFSRSLTIYVLAVSGFLLNSAKLKPVQLLSLFSLTMNALVAVL
jgi:hypothetical protein